MINKTLLFSTIFSIIFSYIIYYHLSSKKENSNRRILQAPESKLNSSYDANQIFGLFMEDLKCSHDGNYYIDVLDKDLDNIIELDKNKYTTYESYMKLDFNIQSKKDEQIFDRLLDTDPNSYIRPSVIMAFSFVITIFNLIVLYTCACYDYCPIIFKDKKQLFFKYKILFITITIFLAVNIIFPIYLFNNQIL